MPAGGAGMDAEVVHTILICIKIVFSYNYGLDTE